MLINVRAVHHNGMLIMLYNDQLTSGHADELMK